MRAASVYSDYLIPSNKLLWAYLSEWGIYWAFRNLATETQDSRAIFPLYRISCGGELTS